MAAATGCGDNGPAIAEMGQLEMHMTGPDSVHSIHVTVTGPGIDMPYPVADLEPINGVWTGTVLNVPVGEHRVVTALGYDIHGTLIYEGVTENVAVFNGKLTSITVVLVPSPNDQGDNINTPPHFAQLTHPDTMKTGETKDFVAIALDPDHNAVLTYTWSSTPLGVFDDDNVDQDDVGSVVFDQTPGDEVVVHYTAPDITGFVLVQVTVSDGQSTTTNSFAIAVGAAIAPGIAFDVLPELEITSVERQVLMPHGSTLVSYKLTNPGTDWSPNSMHVTATWSDGDDCDGHFLTEDLDDVNVEIGSPVTRWVTYVASGDAPNDLSSCSLRLSVVDDVGGSLWSGIVVWIEEPLMVFVTSGSVDGAHFDGHSEAADAYCQGYVTTNSGVSPGLYKALLSFDEISASDRIVDGPYIRSDGLPIARNKAELFFGDLPGAVLLNQINRDEHGVPVGGFVFTGTNSDGTTAEARCDNWKSNAGNLAGMGGVVGATASEWAGFAGLPCHDPAHVYCFQQSHVRE